MIMDTQNQNLKNINNEDVGETDWLLPLTASKVQ